MTEITTWNKRQVKLFGFAGIAFLASTTVFNLANLLNTIVPSPPTLTHLRETSINELLGNQLNQTQHNYPFTAAICAIAKDIEAYMIEWIDYHLIGLGFENIYIYDNSDRFDLQLWYDRTRQHPHYSRVHIMHLPGKRIGVNRTHAQKWAYEDCVFRYGQGRAGPPEYNQTSPDSPRHDYFALIDTDEFIVLQQYPQTHTTIHDLLSVYLHPYGGALKLNWMYFGNSNRTLYSPLPVTKRFQYRDRKANFLVKTIVKASDFDHVINPHGVKVHENVSTHDTSSPGAVVPESVRVAVNPKLPSSVVLVYHYRFMSQKEYGMKRCYRGEADGTNRGCNYTLMEVSNDGMQSHMIPRPGQVFDDKAWKFLTSKVPKYQMYDSIEWEDYS